MSESIAPQGGFDTPAAADPAAAPPITGDDDIDAVLTQLHATAEAGLAEHLAAAERLQTTVQSRLADLTGR